MRSPRVSGRGRIMAALLGTALGVSVLAAQRAPAPPKNVRILSDGSRQGASRNLGSLSPTATHSYFDNLASRPEVYRAYSLRDQSELALYAQSRSRPLAVTYDPANDPDPRRQDAAKVVVPADKNSLPNQVRLPIEVSDGSIFITWDAWFGKEFRFENHGIVNYKTFQFASPTSIWSEVRSRFQLAAGSSAVALVDGRAYVTKGVIGPNVTRLLPLSPQIAQFAIEPETWTRYWALFDRTSDWDLYSLWIADENRGPVQLFDRLQLKYRENLLGSFWLEFNTSTDEIRAGRGPLVAYVRNVVMLRNLADPVRVLERPRR